MDWSEYADVNELFADGVNDITRYLRDVYKRQLQRPGLSLERGSRAEPREPVRSF